MGKMKEVFVLAAVVGVYTTWSILSATPNRPPTPRHVFGAPQAPLTPANLPAPRVGGTVAGGAVAGGGAIGTAAISAGGLPASGIGVI